jgi:hypothetical protein
MYRVFRKIIEHQIITVNSWKKSRWLIQKRNDVLHLTADETTPFVNGNKNKRQIAHFERLYFISIRESYGKR